MGETRNRQLHFWLTDEEYSMLLQKMALAGIDNMSAFLRKMALDGMVIRLDLPEIRELTSLLGRCSGIFNQIAKRINSTNRAYAEDIAELREKLDALTDKADTILAVLAVLR